MWQETGGAVEAREHLKSATMDAGSSVAHWSQQAAFYTVEYGPRIVGVLIVLLIAWVASGWVRRVTLTGLTKARFDLTLAKFFANMSRWVVLGLGVLACFETFGIKSTSVAAVVGAIGLAIALGFQGTLGNLAAGVLLLIFRPFKVGDAVIVAGQSGVIDGIDLFTTNLDTGDYRRIIVPNGAIFNAIIENTSYHDRRAVTVNVPLSSAVPHDPARDVLLAAATRVMEHTPGVLSEPEPSVSLAELAPASAWSVTVWVRTPSYGTVRLALLREIKIALDGAGMPVHPPPPVLVLPASSAPLQKGPARG